MEIKTKKLYDGRKAHVLPSYCKSHPDAGKHYYHVDCSAFTTALASGINLSHFIKGTAICNDGNCLTIMIDGSKNFNEH